ncbi:hypothetical protein [Promicromonospora sp. NPDC057488]|uniref:hypothetical protein n=1 Tax=Promicromonospora sp. NPDC057488 TaxID=3346147 RepID=UPI003672A6F8
MGSQIVANNTWLDDNGTVYTANGTILGRVRRSGPHWEAINAKGKHLDTYIRKTDAAASLAR